MNGTLPALRKDLDCRCQETAAGEVLVIKDPASGEYFRLQPAEGFIAAQLDGELTFDELRERIEQRFDASVEVDTLQGFIRTLDRNGLLETERSAASKSNRPKKRLGGSLLYYRIKLLDPERLLSRLKEKTGFFFTRGFVYASAIAILVAMAITLFHAGAIAQDAAQLYQLSTLPLLAVTIFIVVSLHEMAHGLTCKHFGGEVHEMGFMLMYFQPAMYCNVSDAWLFPERYKRLWVGFAGPYFELFVWAVATMAWRVTDTDTIVNQAALVTIAVSGLRTLFNFNPLIKLDGYYLLSDLLEIPNLRKKSFRYVGDRLKALVGSARMPAVTSRERKIYLAYGITAWFFSVSLLAYVSAIVGERMIIDQQRVAFFALTGLISVRFRDKFNSLFGSRKRRGSKRSNSGKKDKSKGPKISSRWLLRGAVAFAAGLLLFFGHLELRVSGPVVVLPEHNADVRAEIDGTVAEILVDEGDIVNKGDMIARLSDREHRAELAKTEAEIRQVNARIDQLMAGPTRREIEVARSEVSSAEDAVAFARAKHRRNKALFEQNLISQNDFDTTREQQAAAENQWIQARNKLQVLLAGTRPEEIDAAEAELSRLQAQRDYLEGQLQRVNVRSPAAGIVTTPSRELHALMRQAVTKGDLIAKVYDLDVVTVEASISEKEIADIHVGQEVGVKVRAYPERIFRGKVVAIAPATQGATAVPTNSTTQKSGGLAGNAAGSDGTSVRVTTLIDNREGLLKPGMTGMAKVYCGERRIVDLVVRRLSRTFRVEFWSWW